MPASAAVRVYQWTLRPVIGANCRFWPSCSEYAVDALRLHGAVRGSALAAKRILRCNPWNEGGCRSRPRDRPADGALMDQKRLFLAIAVSLAILLGFQLLVAPHLPKPPPVAHVAESQLPGATPQEGSPAAPAGVAPPSPSAANTAVPKNVPR